MTQHAPDAAAGHAVGWPAIDALHAECDRCVADFAATPDSPAALAALVEHLGHHFQSEEALMQASSFPPFGCHKREHDEVLAVVERVHEMLVAGDVEVAQRLAAECPHWFDAHAVGMDAPLADWLRAQPTAAGLAAETAA